MNKKDAFEVGAKLLGLYFIVMSLQAFMLTLSQLDGDRTVDVMRFSSSLVFMAAGCTLLLGTRDLVRRVPWLPSEGATEAGTAPSSAAALTSWIALLGIYFFVRATKELLAAWSMTRHHDLDWHYWLADLLTLGLSLVLVFRCHAIGRHLVARSEPAPVSAE